MKEIQKIDIIYIFSAIFHNQKYLLKNCRNKVTMTNRCSALKYDISLKDVKYLKSLHTYYLIFAFIPSLSPELH